MIVWSYSLYGFNKEVYYKPMLENIRLAKLNKVRIIISTTDLFVNEVRSYFQSFLEDIHIEVYPSQTYTVAEMILRFLAVDTLDADFYFIKDADSVVTERELYIMNHWMHLSEENFMIIRDNPVHVSPIMAGMFGFRRSARELMVSSCRRNFPSTRKIYQYGDDQRWLAEEIYPLIINSTQVYSSYFYFTSEKLIRISRANGSGVFIGAPSEGNVNPKSLEHYFFSFYANKLLNIPFINSLPVLLSRLIYGRVRPSLYIAAIFRRLKR